jgi:hypothetical protein
MTAPNNPPLAIPGRAWDAASTMWPDVTGAWTAAEAEAARLMKWHLRRRLTARAAELDGGAR